MAESEPGRIPPGVTIQQWVDHQIRTGKAKGTFDDLPGAGKPLELTDHHDADWWIKKKIRDEGLEILPPSLMLRRDIERAVQDARNAPTEEDARRRIEAVNDRIRAANRVAIAGPPVTLVPYDVDELLNLWRSSHPVDLSRAPRTDGPGSAQPTGAGAGGSSPARWLQRWRVRNHRSATSTTATDRTDPT